MAFSGRYFHKKGQTDTLGRRNYFKN